MHFFLGDELNLNRLPEPIDISRKIKQYGESNLYPQIVHSILLRSPLTKSAVNLLADFYAGDGFAENGDTVLNRHGQNLNDVLTKAADDLAEYRGFAIHLNFNAAGSPIEMTPVPFGFVRLGLPDKTGFSKDCKISNNWETVNQQNFEDGFDEAIQTFPLWLPFDFRPTSRGAIFYFSDLGPARYPLCSYDPILDNAQSDAENQLFELNNIINGFHSGTIFKHYGPFENDRAKDRFLEQISSMTGAKGGASVMVLEVDEALAASEMVEGLPAQNNDALFSQTTINIRDRVQQFFNIPGGLLAVSPTGSVFTVTELGSSFVYMNLRTKNDRRILERFFNRFIGAGEIITNGFESDQMAGDPEPKPPEPTPTPEP